MASSVFIGNSGMTFNGSSFSFPFPGLFPDGAAALPGIAFVSQPSLGLYRLGSNIQQLTFTTGFGDFNVATAARYSLGSGFILGASAVFGWTAGTEVNALDTSLTRQSAGVVNVTTGYAAGSTAGVATFGPGGVTSITVKGGIITAIS